MFGFPVRIHPAFFIMPLLLGAGAISMGSQIGVNVGVAVIIISIVFLFSILVHELGHTFAFRRYGIPSSIVLYWMGGLAIPGGGNVWSQRSVGRLNSQQQIVVSLAGPFFGFMLAGLFIGMVYLMGGVVLVEWEALFPSILPVFPGNEDGLIVGTSPPMWLFLYIGIWANVFWNILNLMPVFPLDGGQVAREFFVQADPRNGIQNSLYLSIAFAAGMAILGLANGNQFMAMFFAYMAFMSYQTLQRTMGGGFGGRRPW